MHIFKIDDMTCGGCAAAVTRAIHAADKDARVSTFPAIRKLEVKTNLTTTDIKQALDKAGYPAKAWEES
jgi:copper chaperone